MKIITNVDNATIKQAASLVMGHYKDDMFLLRLMNEKRFNFTKDTGEQIAQRIVACKSIFYIIPYTHWNPFSKTLGHFENPNYIVNMRKVNALDLRERTKNVFHECLGHGLGYSHKGNRVTAFNLETFPYKGAEMFVQYLKEIGAL